MLPLSNSKSASDSAPPDPATFVGNADAFPILRQWRFFNHASVCPLPKVAADALRAYAAQAESAAYIDSGWYSKLDLLKRVLSGIINAHPDEIALLKNTSEGLGILAAGIDWKSGDRIVTTAVEYPSNIYPWMDLARRVGIDLVLVPEHTNPDGTVSVREADILQALDHPRTRLITLSHVQYASGQRLDLTPIGAACRARGIYFAVDAIQSAGVLPLDVQAMNIDFLSADGHKWLLGPEGAGFLYIRREMLDHVRPPILGWHSVINPQDYGTYDLTLKPHAGRFECGTLTIPAFLAFHASAKLLADVGVDFIAQRLKHLTGHLETGLKAKGWQILSPREGNQWSGGLSFIKKGIDLKAECSRLRREHRIELAVREGRLRASPHFYNTEAEIDSLLEAVLKI